jgi:hypothetical protein
MQPVVTMNQPLTIVPCAGHAIAVDAPQTVCDTILKLAGRPHPPNGKILKKSRKNTAAMT